jgi:renal tumor antigen
MHKYRLISKKGEGTFSEVLKAQSIKTGKYVAVKCMKNHFDSIDKVNNLREIQALKRLSPHPNIIRLLEVLYDEPTGRLALVFELMDMNLYESIKGRRHYLPEA